MLLTEASARRSPGLPDGVVSQLLVGGYSVALPRSPFEVAMQRVTLAPSAVVARHEPDGMEMVAVRAGSALLTTTRRTSERDVVAITGGSAALLQADSVTSIRNAGDTPLVLLVLSLSSTEGPAILTIPTAEDDQLCTPGNPFCVGS
jgi:quercetin dioxygenase-like cupin family protein